MKIYLAIAIMLVFVAAAPKNPFDYSSKRSIASALAQVEAKLKSNSPLETVLNILNSFKDSVNTEQVHHDEIFTKQKQECQSENDFRKSQVQDAQTVLRDSSAIINICNTSKIRTTNVQNVNQKQYFLNQELLNVVLSSAESEARYYQKRGRDYEDALHAIDEAQNILAAIYSGSGSFIDITRVSKEMIQISFNIKETAKFAPIFYAFSQLASQQFDESALERVAQLLDSLKQKIQETYNEYVSSNVISVASFNDQKERLRQTISRLEANNERLQNKLTNLVQCIGTQSATSSAASAKLQRNQQLWDSAQLLCTTFANEYNYATQARRNELQLIASLEEMVAQRFNQVEDERPNLGISINFKQN